VGNTSKWLNCAGEPSPPDNFAATRPTPSASCGARCARRPCPGGSEGLDAAEHATRHVRAERPGGRSAGVKPIGNRIADFACPARKLVVELDGGQHADSADDDRRAAELARHGYRVIRFWNNDVLQNPDGVMDAIRRGLDQ
jgi:very-short-patch-repair endonuclease